MIVGSIPPFGGIKFLIFSFHDYGKTISISQNIDRKWESESEILITENESCKNIKLPTWIFFNMRLQRGSTDLIYHNLWLIGVEFYIIL